MNRQMNLPGLQRIAMEFEKENDIMDQRQEMMDDAIDDVTGIEDEEEGEEVVNQVLDEIGVDLGQAVCYIPSPGAARVARPNTRLLLAPKYPTLFPTSVPTVFLVCRQICSWLQRNPFVTSSNGWFQPRDSLEARHTF